MRGSSVAAACVEEIRAVLLWHAVSDPYAWPESGTRVVVGWWGRRCAREEIASGSIGILWYYVDISGRRGIHVVIELLHAVHGERWERYTWPHTHGAGRDARDAREVAASRERPMR